MFRVIFLFVIIFTVLPALTALAPGAGIGIDAAVEARAETALLARGQEALALIDFPWQQLGYEIVFLEARPVYRAMTFPDEHRIEVYIRPDEDSRKIAFDIAHELGHAIDFSHNTSETRKKWKALRRLDPAVRWFGCARCSDYNTPAGDFAETVAFLLIGPGYFRGRIATPPTPEQIPALKALLQQEILDSPSVFGGS